MKGIAFKKLDKIKKEGEMKAKIISLGLVILLMGLLLPGCAQGQINELEAQITEKDSQIVELENQTATLNSTVEAKDIRIAELEEENAQLQKEIEELTVEEEVSTPATDTAKIEISFIPNPVPCQNGEYRWSVFLKEVNGIGVKLQCITMELHGEDFVESWIDESWLKAINYYLSPYDVPYDVVESRRHVPCNLLVTYVVFIVTGVDDNGNEVRVERRVDFIPISG